MNRDEVTALLALISGRDGRAVGQVEVEAWLEDLGRWDFPTAREAVHRHYATTRDFARPFDVIRMIRAIRDERLTTAGAILPPSHLADDPAAELAWIRTRRELIASGRVPADRRGEIEARTRPELVKEIKAIAAAKAIPIAEGPEKSPAAPTVDPRRAEAAESERARQLAALGAMKAGVER